MGREQRTGDTGSGRPFALRHVSRIPTHCVWELTNACNLGCVHCESTCGERKADELDTRELLALCDELKAIGCKSINLSGGEPLLRPDWHLVCERLVSLGLEPIVVSNLTDLADRQVDRLRRVGVRWVATSIDGPRTIHDRIRLTRGERFSPFRRTMSALRKLRSRGFSVCAITHVNLWNLAALDETAALLEGAGVDLWQLQLGIPEGRLREIADDYLVHPRDLEEIYRFAVRVKERGALRLDLADDIGYFGDDEWTVRQRNGMTCYWGGCMAGYRALSITCDGTVRGCPSLDIPVGNVRERPLRDIWNDESLFWFNTGWDEAKLEGRCKGCPYRRVCRGGCKSLALSTTGSIYRNIYCLNQIRHLGGDPDRREDHGVLI